MNDPQIELLRHDQARLRAEVETLSQRIDTLAMTRQGEAKATEIDIPASPKTIAPPPLPPIPLSARETPLPTATLPSISTPIPVPSPSHPESLELRVGQVWLVRIGIAMLLAGLIFLGNYAYAYFIERVSPLGRDLLLLAASLSLTGLGIGLKRWRESLHSYGQVLAAGGFAGGYYALYGSHYVPALAWVDNPATTGFLMMGWAAGILGIACRRQNQTLGVAAIALAYLASMLRPYASDTPIFDLILAVAAVFMTVRYGWFAASWTALAATYGSALWGSLIHEHSPWTATHHGLLWGIFTLGLLWRHTPPRNSQNQVAILTLNNAGWLLVTALSLANLSHGNFENAFPIRAILFGTVLIATAFVSRRLHPQETAQETALFIQGILCATLGWMTRWHGAGLPLILGVEGVLLAFTAEWRHRRALLTLATLATGIASLVVIAIQLFDPTEQAPTVPWMLAGLLAAGAAWSARGPKREWIAGYFGSLAALLTLTSIHEQVPQAHQFWVLIGAGALVYSLQFLKPLPFFNWVSTAFWGTALFLFSFAYNNEDRTFWANGAVLAAWFLLEQLASHRLSAPLLTREGKFLWLSSLFACTWAFVSLTLDHARPEWSQTLIWAALAGGLLTLGLTCRERIARWWGLGILGTALVRGLAIDIWQFDTLSRIFTFLGLGAVLLALGFIYNRFSETIRKWL